MLTNLTRLTSEQNNLVGLLSGLEELYSGRTRMDIIILGYSPALLMGFTPTQDATSQDIETKLRSTFENILGSDYSLNPFLVYAALIAQRSGKPELEHKIREYIQHIPSEPMHIRDHLGHCSSAYLQIISDMSETMPVDAALRLTVNAKLKPKLESY